MYCKLKSNRQPGVTLIIFIYLTLLFVFNLSLFFSCSSTSNRRHNDRVKNEIAISEELKSLARGKEIWMDPNTGTNGFSCESCHENGFLTNAEMYPRYKHILRTMATLSITHNFAVVKESRGKPWKIGSYDANALTLYVTSLANGKRLSISEPLTYSKMWIKRGKAVFDDPSIGTNKLSCGSCHQKGDQNKQAPQGRIASNLKGVPAIYPRYSFEQKEVITLEQQINLCIEKKLNGSPLPLDSEPIVALCCYLANLSKGRKIAVAKLE